MVYRTRRIRRLRRPARRFPRRRRTRLVGRRRVRRLNYRSKATIVSNRFGTGFPDVYNVKLKYTAGLNFQSGTLTELTGFYRGNVSYDPDTRVNTQPSALEYERFQTIYRYCRCFASKIKIMAVTNGQSAGQICVCPVTSNQQVEFDLLAGDKRARTSQFIVPQGQTRTVVTNYCTTKSIFGLKHAINDNDHIYDFNNVTTTKPFHEWYWYFILTTAEQATGLNVSFQLVITYYCRFFEKIQPLLFDIPNETEEDIPWVAQDDPTGNFFNPEE